MRVIGIAATSFAGPGPGHGPAFQTAPSPEAGPCFAFPRFDGKEMRNRKNNCPALRIARKLRADEVLAELERARRVFVKSRKLLIGEEDKASARRNDALPMASAGRFSPLGPRGIKRAF